MGLIHDFKNDRTGLYRQLASQIEKVEAYKQQNYSLDAVFLEREFTQESVRLIGQSMISTHFGRHCLMKANVESVSRNCILTAIKPRLRLI